MKARKTVHSPAFRDCYPIGSKYLSYGGGVDEVLEIRTGVPVWGETVVVRDTQTGEIREHCTRMDTREACAWKAPRGVK